MRELAVTRVPPPPCQHVSSDKIPRFQVSDSFKRCLCLISRHSTTKTPRHRPRLVTSIRLLSIFLDPSSDSTLSGREALDYATFERLDFLRITFDFVRIPFTFSQPIPHRSKHLPETTRQCIHRAGTLYYLSNIPASPFSHLPEMRYTSFVVPFLVSLLGISATSEVTSASQPSSNVSPSAKASSPKSSVQKRNVKTGLGLKKSLSSESKIAKNVLESTGEGYCSVSRVSCHIMFPRRADELTNLVAVRTNREHALRIRDDRIPQQGAISDTA